MKKSILYSALVCILPLSFFAGGVESPFRFLYYPLIVLLATLQNSKAMLQTALTFSIFYALIPFMKGEDYPFSAVIINSATFLIMGIVSGLIADKAKHEIDSLKKTADAYQALMNDSHLKIMNLQTKIESLSLSYERLQESDAKKTRFFSGVSHEIRAALSSVLSFSEILLNYRDVDEETRREFLGVINGESGRLTQLVNEILDLTRVESGKIEWHMDRINMEEIVRAAVRITEPLAKEKGIQIEIMPSGEDLSAVKGDRGKLLQVVLNLLTNAIKFTARGKISIGIEDMPQEIKVSVMDTGEGIYPEEKEKIFEEFYRIGDDLAGRPKGSGLGLSISRSIVEAHNGKIWVESEIGKGSTFFFTIPKENLVAEQTESMNTLGRRVGGRILVVEEFVHVRQALRSAIEGRGYSTIGLGSVRVALDVLKGTAIDSVIIGYNKGHEHLEELSALARLKGVSLYLAVVINDSELGAQVAVNGYISNTLGSFQMGSLVSVIGKQPKRIMVISDDQAEARNFQLIVGTKGCETDMVSDIRSMTPKTHLPDAIIIGNMQKEKVYRTLTDIRSDPSAKNIPVILTLDTPIRDLKCIGLGPKEYGSGIARIIESLEGDVSDAVDL
jgi:signal transduction histidine kinase/DNA-binding response OmpR family regulator